MPGIDESRVFKPLRIAVLTVSDTRTAENDTSGDTLAERATTAGHQITARHLMADDEHGIAQQVLDWAKRDDIDVILTTGGTGLTYRDVTPEAIRSVMDKEIEGFGELFRWISYQIIATSTVQSRAMGALVHGTYVFALPGSTSACRDAWDQILLFQLDSRHRPCNFAELLPRLKQ